MSDNQVLFLQALTALVIATVFAWMELITSKYPQTWTLILRCRSLWMYSVIYGLLAFGVVLGYEALTSSKAIQLSGTGQSTNTPSDKSKSGETAKTGDLGKNSTNSVDTGQKPTWLTAIFVGLAAKALLHIRLFTVTTGSQAVPVGTETLVMLFEPWLLRNIELYDFNVVRDYIGKRVSLYQDLADVKTRITSRIPIHAKEEKRAFELDVENSADVIGAMELYLRSFGVDTYDRVFPLTS